MAKVKEEPSSILTKVRELEKWIGFESEIKWMATIIVFSYHIFSVYWCYHYAFPAKWQTVVFAYAMVCFTGFGITAGAHRYWAHKAFKATTPLRIIMLLGFAAAGQTTIYQWVRNHRIHHKYSDTESDPHNRERGLFFSHIGWLLMKKKPEVTSKAKEIDMTDIENDPLITWHRKSINPAENAIISALTGGEGWHNFHHSFPFEYKAAEWSNTFDFTTALIHFFEKFGWVYDKREVTKGFIKKYAEKHSKFTS